MCSRIYDMRTRQAMDFTVVKLKYMDINNLSRSAINKLAMSEFFLIQGDSNPLRQTVMVDRAEGTFFVKQLMSFYAWF